MKYTQIQYISILCLISLCTGCGRIVDWATCNFYQGINLAIPYDIICSYKQSVTIYDQLATRAHFDVLWLSNDIRDIYTTLYARRHNYSEMRKNVLLRRQLEENNHYLVFYILSLKDIALGTKYADWSISLEIDGVMYFPDNIRRISLLPEYRTIFKDEYNNFKEAYQVLFYKKNMDGSPRISSFSNGMILHFKTDDKATCMTWNFDEYSNWSRP